MVPKMLVVLLLAGLCACGAEKNEKSSTATSEAKSPDLSTKESAAKALITVLKNDDKPGFHRILSPRLKEKAKDCETNKSEECKRRHSLDAIFGNWKGSFDKKKVTLKGLKEWGSLKNIEGAWRLDDS